MTKPKMLTLKEAHEHSGVSVRTLERWIARSHNPLRSVRVFENGHYVRKISQRDLDAYERPQMGGVR